MAPTPQGSPARPARHASPPKARASDWLSLTEASRILGVSGATLRRWADDGRVPVFTTPGGHRRFSRRVLHGLLPAARRRRPTLAHLGASPERLVRAYHPPATRPEPSSGLLEHLSEGDRVAFRERGRALLGLLIDFLDAADPEVAAARLAAASQLAAGHGRQLALLGVSMTEAVEAFLRFRTPFTNALAATARQRGLDTREATTMLVTAEAALDQLLVATMTGYGAAAGGTGG